MKENSKIFKIISTKKYLNKFFCLFYQLRLFFYSRSIREYRFGLDTATTDFRFWLKSITFFNKLTFFLHDVKLLIIQKNPKRWIFFSFSFFQFIFVSFLHIFFHFFIWYFILNLLKNRISKWSLNMTDAHIHIKHDGCTYLKWGF